MHARPPAPVPSVEPQTMLYRPTWVEINVHSFQANLRAVKAFLKRGKRAVTGIVAVVKANAYGHMALPLAKAALKEGVAALGVSSIEEGIALRRGGIKGKILILGSIYPLENLAIAAQYDLTPTISSAQGLAQLVRIASRTGRRLPFHLKVDTGMGRIGVTAASAAGIIEKIVSRKEVICEGVYMHFACAASDERFTRMQLEQFGQVVRAAKRRGLKCVVHAANSAALLVCPKAHFDWVRPGIMLYGLPPFKGAEKKIALKPVLSWKTRIVFLKRVPAKTPLSYDSTYTTGKQSVIATLPVGYADGYPRSLSNKGEVLVSGKRCPVVGRVTMDMIMVDVTGVQGAAIGGEAVLIGQQGAESITAEEFAAWAGTIHYEAACAISYRVPRVLLHG